MSSFGVPVGGVAASSAQVVGGLPSCNQSDVDNTGCPTHDDATVSCSVEDRYDVFKTLEGNVLDLLQETDEDKFEWVCMGNNCKNMRVGQDAGECALQEPDEAELEIEMFGP